MADGRLDLTRRGLVAALAWLHRALSRGSVRCALAWLLLYVALWGSGLRIDPVEARGAWQIAPLDALEQRPLQSLWYLHAQPPGWNAVIALLLRLSPAGLTLSMYIVMMMSGAVLCLSVHRVVAALGVSNRVSSIVTVVATMNSQVMMSGFSFLYELPAAALIAALVALSASPMSSRRIGAISAVATLLAMTRALYHPIWLVVVLAAVSIAARGRAFRSAIAVSVGLSLLVVGGWTVKNYVQYGTVGLSSWSGMNLLRSVKPAVSDEDIDTMRAVGVISDVSVVGPFGGYSAYEPYMPPCSARSGVMILKSPTKSGPPISGPFGEWVPENFNYECFIPVYRQAGEDALAIIRAQPVDWLEARMWSIQNWFTVVEPEIKSSVLQPLHWVTRIGFVIVPHPGLPDSWADNKMWVREVPLTAAMLLLTGLVVVESVRRAARWARSGFDNSQPTGLLFGVVAVTVAWTIAAGVVLELSEQSRFRMMIDPLVIAVGGATVARWFVARRSSHTLADREFAGSSRLCDERVLDDADLLDLDP